MNYPSSSYPHSYPASEPYVESTQIGSVLNVLDSALRNFDAPPWLYEQNFNAYVVLTGSDGGFMHPAQYSEQYSRRSAMQPVVQPSGFSTTGISTAPLDVSASEGETYYGVNPDPARRTQFEWAQLLELSRKFVIDPSEYGGILIGASHAGMNIGLYPSAQQYALDYAAYNGTAPVEVAAPAPAKGLGIAAAAIALLTLFRK